MSGEALFYLVAGAAAGGAINGLAGFGTALFALGFFLSIVAPLQAVAMVLVLSMVSGVQGMWVVRGAILDNPRRLARFLVPGLFGIPLGVYALSFIDATTLKLLIATLLIAYGGYFTLRRNLPKFERPTPIADSAIGFAGGILGGAASLSGALPTMWCAMRPWTRGQTRAVLQPYNFAILGLTTVMLYFRGAYTAEILPMLAIVVPVSIASSALGILVYQRLSDELFRRLLIALTFVSGAVLMLRELF